MRYLATSIYMRRNVIMYSNNDVPWEKPRIKRILELFRGRIFSIKKTNTVHKEVTKDEEIPR